jgi:beta-lactamase regulating signal transducer with metallopeptidase domain
MDTLLNWLWQGTVVAAAAAIALKLLGIRGAAWRYRFWWVSMALVLMLPAISAVWTALSTPAPVDAAAVATTYLPDVYVSDILLIVFLVVAAWISWMFLHVIRALLAFRALRRVRTFAAPFPAEREARLEHWLALRQSTPTHLPLVVSDDVQNAAVIGFRRPAIAVSPRLLDTLTDAQLDRVLVHEWAHVARRDHVVHGAQLLIRILAGCHPAVWWIDRQLDAERESACDDMTVRVTGSPKAYAACLARLAEISATRPASLPIPAAITSSNVRRRIIRVLGIPAQATERQMRLKAAAAAACIVVIGLAAASSALVLPAVERAVMLVDAVPAPHIPTSAEIRSNDGAVPMATPPSRPRHRRSGRAASTAASAADEPQSAPVPASVSRLEPAPAATIEHLPLAAALNTDSIPMLPVTGAPAPPPTTRSVTPWVATKSAGVSVGRASQKAAESTAGLFTRFGKKIAASF